MILHDEARRKGIMINLVEEDLTFLKLQDEFIANLTKHLGTNSVILTLLVYYLHGWPF